MAPVTASTNRDSPKMDFAGVDAGAKIFVGLKGWAVSAKAAAVPQIQTTTCDIRTRQLLEPRGRNWSPYFSGNGSELESEFLHQSTTYLQLIQTTPMAAANLVSFPGQDLCLGVLESSVETILRAANGIAKCPDSTISLAGTSHP